MRQAHGETYPSFGALLEQNDTRAFLVLHHGAIVYERYFGSVTAETRLPAFSMSKTLRRRADGRGPEGRAHRTQ